MKTIIPIFTLLSVLASLQGGLLPAKKEDRELKQDDSRAYLKHVFPPALSFGIDPLPADRMMLVTKAPKTTVESPFAKPLGAEANATAETIPPVEPVVTIDPPSVLAEPALPVPPAVQLLPGPGVRVSPGSSSVVTSEEILRLLELGGDSTLKSNQSIIVPFEMPFSHTPSAAVLSSKARYIKRIK